MFTKHTPKGGKLRDQKYQQRKIKRHKHNGKTIKNSNWARSNITWIYLQLQECRIHFVHPLGSLGPPNPPESPSKPPALPVAVPSDLNYGQISHDAQMHHLFQIQNLQEPGAVHYQNYHLLKENISEKYSVESCHTVVS
ncbi:hypothetical protein CEXT_624121 [Caerostris extrusa]|uniref:Uncharacterized protein n=1 Tax=Caerostris extrusa TaxID=172846 RepID=A0AAV4MZZ2_CAEEX|nr:hypothetical protein CEXT_624121 [Caerostris extrusa]